MGRDRGWGERGESSWRENHESLWRSPAAVSQWSLWCTPLHFHWMHRGTASCQWEQGWLIGCPRSAQTGVNWGSTCDIQNHLKRPGTPNEPSSWHLFTSHLPLTPTHISDLRGQSSNMISFVCKILLNLEFQKDATQASDFHPSTCVVQHTSWEEGSA